MLLYLPKAALERPVPAFLGLNFKGNHATTDEVDVRPSGIDAQTGAVSTPHFLADETITMIAPKPGVHTTACGHVTVAPLSYIEPLIPNLPLT